MHALHHTPPFTLLGFFSFQWIQFLCFMPFVYFPIEFIFLYFWLLSFVQSAATTSAYYPTAKRKSPTATYYGIFWWFFFWLFEFDIRSISIKSSFYFRNFNISTFSHIQIKEFLPFEIQFKSEFVGFSEFLFVFKPNKAKPEWFVEFIFPTKFSFFSFLLFLRKFC